jgi:hypothetical protein
MVVLGPREETGGGADMTEVAISLWSRAQSMRGRVNKYELGGRGNEHPWVDRLFVGMILIGGAMTWANYIDHQRDKRRQARAHQHGDDVPSPTSAGRGSKCQLAH